MDTGNFEEIYHDLHTKLLSYANKLINGSGADDVVQEAFCLAFEKGILNSHANPTAWLYTAVRNNAYNLYRYQNRELYIYLDEQKLNPEKFEYHYGLIELVEFFKQVLSQEEYYILNQIYFSGFSERELAKELNVTMQAMHSRVYRIRKKLEKKVPENYLIIMYIFFGGLNG